MSVYIFDVTNMEEKVRFHFDKFISENPSIANVDRIQDYYKQDIQDGYWWRNSWIDDYIKVWNKDKDKVYIYIEEKDMKGYYFQARMIKELKQFCDGNSSKYLKKCVNNRENIFFKSDNVFTIFSIFYKYCIDNRQLS